MPQTERERPDYLLGNLAAEYRRHLHQYERWLLLAQRAEEKLDAGAIDEFLHIHQEKQNIIEQLRDEERRLRKERDAVRESLGLAQFTLKELEQTDRLFDSDGAFATALADWRELLDELSDTIEKVAKLEKQTETKLRQHLGSLSDAVVNTRSTRYAVQQYNKPEAGDQDARFIDRLS